MIAKVEDLGSLDRRIIAALQIDGRASWTDIASLVGASVTTVARRGKHLLDSGALRVAVVPNVGWRGPVELFFVKLGCASGTQDDVGRTLSNRRDARFLALVTGTYDVVVELVAPKNARIDEVLIREIQAVRGVERCETDLVLHTYKASQDWSRSLLDQMPAEKPVEPHQCDPTHFDDLDRRLLQRFEDDGRASFPRVAEALGVNESTVRRRFEALTSRGCAFVLTLVPAPAIGFESEILFWIHCSPANLESAASELARHPGVRYLAATLGSPSLMCEVILPTTRDVFEFTTSTLARVDGVLSWTANVELVTYKRGFVRTPWT